MMVTTISTDEIKSLKDFSTVEHKKKDKAFLFRMDKNLMAYLDYMHLMSGQSRSDFIREAIEEKGRSRTIIKRLLDSKKLAPLDQEFVVRIMHKQF